MGHLPYNTVYGISNPKSFHAYNLYPLSFNLSLFWPGPLFPLSLLVLGINLIRSKSIEWWVGVLICLSAIVFPLSRIPRIPFIAHFANALLLIPMLYIGWHFLNNEHNLESQQKITGQ